jgi:hypothetical protein
LRQNSYPTGYRVLCHNCNFALGHYGYCPHKHPSSRYAEALKHSRSRGGDRISAKATAVLDARAAKKGKKKDG